MCLSYRLISVLVLLPGLLFSALPARAADGAGGYIQTLGNNALTVITNKDFDKSKKQTELERIFSDNVDFSWVARFVMGRFWRQATDTQKTRYVEDYKKFLMLHYTSRFTDYTSGSFKVTGTKDDGEGEYTVSTQMQTADPGSEPVQVDYRVRHDDGKKGRFHIFDVIVEGVSLIATQRSEFGAVLEKNGIDYLIGQLEAKSKPEDVTRQ